MESPTNQNKLQRVLLEIENLLDPPNLGYLAQQSGSAFTPGFTALPAVTILSRDSWRGKALSEVEHWNIGDLLPLGSSVDSEVDGQKTSEKVYFTPLSRVSIPQVDVDELGASTPFMRKFKLTPRDRWERCEFSLALVPWMSFKHAPPSTDSSILTVGSHFEFLRHTLKIESAVEGSTSIRFLEPEWELTSYSPSAELDGMRYPLIHARTAISPYVFRIRINPSSFDSSGNREALYRKPIVITFYFDEEQLNSLYRSASLPVPAELGFRVYFNAIPLANIDLSVWPEGDTFGRFVEESGQSSLGMAGVFNYDRDAIQGGWDKISSRRCSFAFELNSDGVVVNHHRICGDGESKMQKKLLWWMSHGSRLNGASFRYKTGPITQPMEKASQALSNAYTIVNCFGGASCIDPKRENVYSNLIINALSLPKSIVTPEALRMIVTDLVSRLGYSNVIVKGPVAELRLVRGLRRRITTIYLVNSTRNPLKTWHLNAIRSYLRSYLPFGSEMLIEEDFTIEKG